MRQDGKVGFELGAYDRRRALVIDPVLDLLDLFRRQRRRGLFRHSDSWALRRRLQDVLRWRSMPRPTSISRVRPRLPISRWSRWSATPPSAFQQALAVAPDVFVTKLNAAGSAIAVLHLPGRQRRGYHRRGCGRFRFQRGGRGEHDFHQFSHHCCIGFPGHGVERGRARVRERTGSDRRNSPVLHISFGDGTESARGLALDSENKIYVIGTTTSKDVPDATHSFPATLGAIQVTSLGTSQFFVSKIDPR